MNKIVFDYNRLHGRIVEKFKTIAKFAEAIGVTPTMVSTKLNSGTAFTSDTMVRWAAALDLEVEDYGPYFCCPKSLVS